MLNNDELMQAIIADTAKWLCPNLGEMVGKEECKECNDLLECGCCDFVVTGEAPYNCKMCGRIQIWTEDMQEAICLLPNASPEEIERTRKDFLKNPDKYFVC